MRSVGFEGVEMEAHCFATSDFDPDTYGVAGIPIISSFVAGRDGVGKDQAEVWAAEQQDLGRRGEFFFSCTQFCFTARRPG